MSVRKKISNLRRNVRFNISALKKRKFKNFFQLQKGFYNDTVIIDGITSENYKEYLSDRQYLIGHPWNGPFSGIIDNKLYLPYLLNDYKEYLPKTWFYKDKSGFLPIIDGLDYPEYRNVVRLSSVEFLDFVKSEKAVILKHTYSSVGKGFHILEFENELLYLDKKLTDREQIVKFLNSLDEYIVQEKILQTGYANKINQTSVNTIRLQCAWNKDKKSFEIIRAFHRFGTSGQLVDNLGQGNGVLVYIDPMGGKMLKKGVVSDKGEKTYIKDQDIIHPDSKILLSGFEIPNYKILTDIIIKISNSISFLRWIGWDIALNENDFKIIEANSRTTLDTIQQDKGFLSEPWLAALFKKEI